MHPIFNIKIKHTAFAIVYLLLVFFSFFSCSVEVVVPILLCRVIGTAMFMDKFSQQD